MVNLLRARAAKLMRWGRSRARRPPNSTAIGSFAFSITASPMTTTIAIDPIATIIAANPIVITEQGALSFRMNSGELGIFATIFAPFLCSRR